MNEINFYDSTKKKPKPRQRILYYRPNRLSQIGEMIYYPNDYLGDLNFEDITPYWSEEINKDING